MRDRPPNYSLPSPAQRAVRKLGRDIRDARLRRRIPAALLAERASTSRTTLYKIERGDPGVSIGLIASVLFVLGLDKRLSDLADVHHDEQGLTLETSRLPQRVRRRRRSAPGERS